MKVPLPEATEPDTAKPRSKACPAPNVGLTPTIDYHRMIAWKAMAKAVVGRHVLQQSGNMITDAVDGLTIASDKALAMSNDSVTTALVERDDARYAIWRSDCVTGLEPYPYLLRGLQETATGDQRLLVEKSPECVGDQYTGVIYRRIVRDVPMKESLLSSWAPMGDWCNAMGAAAKNRLAGCDSTVTDILGYCGLLIHRGIMIICTNGTIRCWYDPSLQDPIHDTYGRWIYERRIDNHAPEYLGVDGIDGFQPFPVGDPMTYSRSVNLTVEEAEQWAIGYCNDMDRWTGGESGGNKNLRRMIAAPFMRSHPEVAYVLQGVGSSGKSVLTKDLMKHLGDQAMTFSFDLLNQVGQLSAENAMGELTTHLLAVTDDYDPRYGRFNRCLPNLKTLLTGQLPFNPRKRGQDATHGIPQATHVITTNFQLPIGDSQAERRRFAFAVIRIPIRGELLTIERRGHWPLLMLASAMTWVTCQDDTDEKGNRVIHQRDVQFQLEADDVDDTLLSVAQEILINGSVLASDHPEMRGRWKELGVKRSKAPKDDNGKRPSIYVPPKPGNSGYGTWMAVVQAIEAIPDSPSSTNEKADGFIPDAPPQTPVEGGIHDWLHAIAEAAGKTA